MNFTDLLYSPNYLIIGVPAVLTVSETFGSVDLTVIDKTDAIDAGSVELRTISPAAVARVSELNDNGVVIADINGSILVFNGKTWRVESVAFHPSPNGESDGELWMFLIEGE